MRTSITLSLTLMILMGGAFDLVARTIKDVFVSEPGNVLQLLSQRTKLDMIDYLNEGRMVDVKNEHDGVSHFNKVTDNYMSIQLTGNTKVELLLVSITQKDSVVVAVTTVKLPSEDSRIEFFTPDWKKIDAEKHIKAPTMKDFIVIPKGDKMKKAIVLDKIEFPIISYTINPESNTIIARHGLKEYMSKEDYERVAPYLTDSIELRLKGKTFKH